MEIYIRKFEKNDVTEMVKIWDEVVEDGIAFPQEELLDEVTIGGVATYMERADNANINLFI